jgi:hypothetical protein
MANITWADRTDARTATGATTEWGKDQANPLKAWANSPSATTRTLTASGGILTIPADTQGDFNDYTISSNETWNVTPFAKGCVMWFNLIVSGTPTIIKGTGISYDYNTLFGRALTAGTYRVLIATLDTSGVDISVPELPSGTATLPTITSLTMATDNTYADLLLSEGIYGANDGSTPAALSDLTVTFAQSGGTATAWTASSAKQNDSATEGSASALVGGETTIRIFGSITGTADGNETLTVTPADGTSLYNSSGNAMDSAQTSVDNLAASIIVMQDDFAGITIDTGKWTVTDAADTIDISQNNQLLFTGNGVTGGSINGRTNHVGSINTFSGGVDTQCMQIDVVSTSNPSDLSAWFDIWDGTQNNEITIVGTVADRTKARLIIRLNNSSVYDLDTSIALINTWKIEHIGTSIKFFYISAPDTWTQAGTTQTVDFTGKTLYPKIAASANLNSDISAMTVAFDNFYQTDAIYSTQYPTT